MLVSWRLAATKREGSRASSWSCEGLVVSEAKKEKSGSREAGMPPVRERSYPMTSIFSFDVGKKLREKTTLPSVGRPNSVAGSILSSK
jgi:hypothetical protein